MPASLIRAQMVMTVASSRESFKRAASVGAQPVQPESSKELISSNMSDKKQEGGLLGGVTGTLDSTLTGGKEQEGKGGLLGGVTDTVGKVGNTVGGAASGTLNTVGETADSAVGGTTKTVGDTTGNLTGGQKK
ncbi:MAG: cytosolic Fe-S cluster assembly factor nbp35 [Chaenotheca gracillima]|nr:MAG: cytosolic Fe-S cluster assembly factor nbp35 [Chaenotheca gracillima]